jgi:hypothetical protein
VADLPTLMGNALALLEDGGLFEIEVPYERAPTAWQDPTHVRALNEKSWLYYTDWFWYLGWFTHRFEVAASGWMDAQLRDCAQDGAQFMRVTLRKVVTTPHERTVARAMRADFGGVPSDHAAPADVPPLRLVVVDDGASAATGDHLLADALPVAQRVLEVGAPAASLEAAWRRRHPGRAVHWTCVEPAALRDVPADAVDLCVLSTPIESLSDPEALLLAMRRHAGDSAALVLAADNGASWDALEALLEGEAPTRPAFSAATLTRLLLDTGWLPSRRAASDGAPASAEIAAAAGALAKVQGVPPATLQRVLSAERLVMHALPAPTDAHADNGPARFTVVVPTTRDGQLRRNVQASPGLIEVNARIVAYRGAADAAEAFEQSLEHCTTEWVLYAHQDVYFPRGFGARLNALLAGIPDAERRHTLIGFAGLGAEGQHAKPAGLVIDRTSRFDHAASDAAVSIDELAVVMARDSVHRIDPALGWHLWATDLCLTSITRHQRFARIVRLPLFHHSSNDYTLGDAFHRSAERLAAKHAGFGAIATLCGTIDAPALAAA